MIGNSSPVFSTSISFDNEFIIAGCQDGTIKLFHLPKHHYVATYKCHSGPVWDVKFGHYGQSFGSASEDKLACFWVQKQTTPVRIFTDHLDDVNKVCFMQSMNYMATASKDGILRIFCINSNDRYF